MGASTFTWVLLAFPAYLILTGKFPTYMKLAGAPAETGTPISSDGAQ